MTIHFIDGEIVKIIGSAFIDSKKGDFIKVYDCKHRTLAMFKTTEVKWIDLRQTT